MIEITQKIPYTQFYYNSPWFETTTSSKWKDKWNDQYQCRSTIKNTSLSITNVQANYLGTYTSKSKIRRTTLMAAVLTYYLLTCFLLTASDWSSNVQHRKCRSIANVRPLPLPYCDLVAVVSRQSSKTTASSSAFAKRKLVLNWLSMLTLFSTLTVMVIRCLTHGSIKTLGESLVSLLL